MTQYSLSFQFKDEFYSGERDIAYVIDIWKHCSNNAHSRNEKCELEDCPNLTTIFETYSWKNSNNTQDSFSLNNFLYGLGYTIEETTLPTDGWITKQDLTLFLAKCVLADFSNVRSVLIFFNTHGNRHGIITSDDQVILYDDILMAFDFNNLLRNKLKWFIFNSCHGPKETYENENTCYQHLGRVKTFTKLIIQEMQTLSDEAYEIIKKPHCDTIVIYEATLGYTAYRRDKIFLKMLKQTYEDIKNNPDHWFLSEFLNRLNCNFGLSVDKHIPQMVEYVSAQTSELKLNICSATDSNNQQSETIQNPLKVNIDNLKLKYINLELTIGQESDRIKKLERLQQERNSHDYDEEISKHKTSQELHKNLCYALKRYKMLDDKITNTNITRNSVEAEVSKHFFTKVKNCTIS